MNTSTTAPKTAAELDARLAALPDCSRAVYAAAQTALYAEPGFSDVKPGDLAKATGFTLAAVRGALGHLISVGLVYLEPEGWVHTYEHDNDLRAS